MAGPAPATPLATLLGRRRGVEARLAGDAALASRVARLRQWQGERLARSYADLAARPQYTAAVRFFLSDVYGAQDFARRDQDLDRAAHILERTLPHTALEVLCAAVELDALSRELDVAMAGVLAEEPIDEARYARAYRSVGRRAERERQIELVGVLGERLDHIVRHAWIGGMLRLARRPAQAAGFAVLQDFLERGFAAFSRLGGSADFLATIARRERELMECWFGGGA